MDIVKSDTRPSTKCGSFLRARLTKTRMCKYLREKGSCDAGNSCFYAHSEAELVPKPNLQKTKLCYAFMSSKCRLGDDCRYAHNDVEMRGVTPLVVPVLSGRSPPTSSQYVKYIEVSKSYPVVGSSSGASELATSSEIFPLSPKNIIPPPPANDTLNEACGEAANSHKDGSVPDIASECPWQTTKLLNVDISQVSSGTDDVDTDTDSASLKCTPEVLSPVSDQRIRTTPRIVVSPTPTEVVKDENTCVGNSFDAYEYNAILETPFLTYHPKLQECEHDVDEHATQISTVTSELPSPLNLNSCSEPVKDHRQSHSTVSPTYYNSTVVPPTANVAAGLTVCLSYPCYTSFGALSTEGRYFYPSFTTVPSHIATLPALVNHSETYDDGTIRAKSNHAAGVPESEKESHSHSCSQAQAATSVMTLAPSHPQQGAPFTPIPTGQSLLQIPQNFIPLQQPYAPFFHSPAGFNSATLANTGSSVAPLHPAAVPLPQFYCAFPSHMGQLGFNWAPTNAS